MRRSRPTISTTERHVQREQNVVFHEGTIRNTTTDREAAGLKDEGDQTLCSRHVVGITVPYLSN